jgi:hypothetical protein
VVRQSGVTSWRIISTTRASGITALDACAALVAALDRARRADDLTLRDFRAAVAAAEITSRYATITAGMAGEDAGPLLVTGLAWQLAGRASMVFHEGRRGEASDRQGVVAWSQPSSARCATR